MLTIIIRTVMIYLVATVAVRIMGKRQVSDMQTSELVITLIISEVASLPRVIHLPLVKSGTGTGMEPIAMDSSESGVIAIQVAVS